MISILRIAHSALLAILLTSTTIYAQFTISTGKMRWQLPPGQITADSDPREVLTKAWAAIKTVKSFRFRMEWLPDFPDRTTVIEFVSPDRYHTTQRNKETIVIGNDLYEKMGDKPWRKVGGTIDNGDNTAAATLLKVPNQKWGDSMKMARDIKLIGADKIDGVESLLYEYDNYDSSGKTLFIKMKVWVAVADGFVRRAEGQIQVEPHKTTMIYTYYDYNSDIKIEPPDLLAGQPAPETMQVEPQLRLERRGLGSGDGSDKPFDSKPVLLNRPTPSYTDKARDNKVQGVVRLRVLVGEDGLVKSVSVVRGLPDGLDEMAVKAARKMKFRPAMKDGKPTAFWLNNVLVEFNIKR